MRNKFRIGLLSMAAVGFVGCADKLTDDVAQGGQGNGDEAENYVVFKIGNIGSETRAEEEEKTPGAGDFLEGLAEEHAVSTKAGVNFVYFFDNDENNTFVGATPLELLGQTDDPTHKPDHEGQYNDNGNEKVYQARIKGTEEDLKKYKQCLVILNGNPQELNALKNKSLSDILEVSYETDADKNLYMGWFKDGETNYFTMSNTVYLDGEKVKSAQEIKPGQICKTMAEAQKDPIVVHVERVLAKFELNKGKGSEAKPITSATEIDPSPNVEPGEDGKGGDDKNLTITFMRSTKEDHMTGDDLTFDEDDNTESADHYTEWKASNRKWKVKIVGWGMNATESETYWVKNLQHNNKKFGKWTHDYNNTFGWNDPARLRSYWAVDPHYNGNGEETADDYPHQYRTALDKEGIVPGVDETGAELKSNLVLEYNSYDQFDKFPNNDNGYRYTVENTFDYEWFDDGTKLDFKGSDYKRTSTHAVVAAELLIADSEGDTPTNYSTKTVYQYDSYYWEAEGTTKYQDMSKSLKKYMLNQVLFHWALENDFKELYVDNEFKKPLEASSDDFNTYFEVVAATVKGGDGRAMMQLKKNVALYYKDEEGKLATIGYENYKDAYDDFTKTYLYAYGTARRFDDGKMYYYIPIKHMSTEDIVDNEYEYNVGKYGVVRNHWYKLNINAIKNPGIPVDDPGQPIIPNDDPDQDYYAAFEIVILPWHVITNEVTFE